ncbi:MAG TPA: DUF1906 domain-containing protein [Bacteroidia bacterium]|jgi:hypothetical protein|nr:DUF1906 domain-containing protein [Bacteroidia bacterium]
MTVKKAIEGIGFDVDQPISASEADAFLKAGNIFCIRYIPRTPALIKGNLTGLELQMLLTAGLAVMVVQHVAEPGWQPSGALGTQYGQYAAAYAKAIGYQAGANVWLDLEEVADAATPEQVIEYCKAWYDAVLSTGYVPGLYCGYGTKLTPQQLYDLPFTHYWNAYNGPGVATRGCQLLQRTEQVLNGIKYDPNHLQKDNLNDLPIWVTN